MMSADQNGVLVQPTGNPAIDGVLWGYKWPTTALTYAFPASASSFAYALQNYAPFNAQQQKASIDILLKDFAAVSGLTFVAGQDPATANIRAANVSGIDYQNRNPPVFTKPADTANTAEANPPDPSPESPKSAYGDNLFNPVDFLTPAKGNYAYFTIIHEFGHSLGLKHGHAAQAIFNTQITLPALPADRDSNEFSVMTYRSFVGGPVNGGVSPEAGGYAQTLMMYDIAALQTLYGANFQTNATDTVYKFDATTGEMFINGAGQGAPVANRVFLTVWDGGGTDTYDFSNYTQDQAIDLRPGNWSLFSDVQRANLGALKDGDAPTYARGNVFNALQYQNDARSLIENAIGGSGNDTITGNDARNALKGNGGNDKLDGGLGTDTAIFSGKRADYTISGLDASKGIATIADTVAGRDGTDQTTSIERFKFSDITLAFDEGAAQIYRLYQAAFSRTPDKGGLSYWVNKMDTTITLRDAVFNFMASQEFQTAYGNSLTNEQLIQQIYVNILGRAPEKAGFDYWVGRLNDGASRLDVFASISESNENRAKVAPVIGQGIELDSAVVV